jgi:hypothetical protein
LPAHTSDSVVSVPATALLFSILVALNTKIAAQVLLAEKFA